MDLDGFLTPQTAIFAVGIFVLCFCVRRVCEGIWPTLSTKTPLSRWQKIWEGLILPVMPPVFGAVMAIVFRAYPFPTSILHATSARAMYGLVAGFFSSWAYSAVKFVLKKKWDVAFPDDTKEGG